MAGKHRGGALSLSPFCATVKQPLIVPFPGNRLRSNYPEIPDSSDGDELSPLDHFADVHEMVRWLHFVTA